MDANALFAQATIALKAKRNDEARRLLAEVLRLNPRHEEAWLALAAGFFDFCLIAPVCGVSANGSRIRSDK